MNMTFRLHARTPLLISLTRCSIAVRCEVGSVELSTHAVPPIQRRVHYPSAGTARGTNPVLTPVAAYSGIGLSSIQRIDSWSIARSDRDSVADEAFVHLLISLRYSRANRVTSARSHLDHYIRQLQILVSSWSDPLCPPQSACRPTQPTSWLDFDAAISGLPASVCSQGGSSSPAYWLL